MPPPEFDQNYTNFSYYPLAAQQAGFGAPQSQQFQNSMPYSPRDFMARENKFEGNSYFSQPGVNWPNHPILSLGANLAMQSMLGRDFYNTRPFSTPPVSDMDFFAGRMRQQAFMDQVPRILNSSSGDYLTARLGQAGGNNMVQQMMDAFSPAGSARQAAQMLMGSTGRLFSQDYGMQAMMSAKAYGQIEKAFQSGDKNKDFWDFRTSYGLDRVQTVEAADAALRYGVGGMSEAKFAKAAGEGRLGDVMKQNNRLFSAAQQVFGKDKGMEELAQLMTRSIDGFQGMDASKATDLLNKIQATSRAVNISTQAFTEYSQMFKQLYGSMGVSGPVSVEHAMSASSTASAVTQMGLGYEEDLGGGRKWVHGANRYLSDQNKNMVAQMENAADLNGSDAMAKMGALATTMQNISPEQAAAINIKGVGTLADADRQIKQAIADGNLGRANTLLDQIDTGIQSNEFGFAKGFISRHARYGADAEDLENVGKRYGSQADLTYARGKEVISNFGTMTTMDIERKGGSDLVKKVGGKDKITAMLSRMSGPQEAGQASNVMKAIEAMGGMGLSSAEQQRLATMLSESARDMINHPLFAQGQGEEREASKRRTANQWAAGTEKGHADAKAREASAAKNKDVQTYIQELSGGLTRPPDEKELIFALMNGMSEEDQAKYKKDGKWDVAKMFEDREALAKKYTKSFLKIGDMKGAMAVMDPQNIEDAVKAGQEAYDRSLQGAEDPNSDEAKQKAEEARTGAIREHAKKVRDRYEKGQGDPDKGAEYDKWKSQGQVADAQTEGGKKEGAMSAKAEENLGKIATLSDKTNDYLSKILDQLSKDEKPKRGGAVPAAQQT